MKIANINIVPYGSTGKIMLQLAEVAREHGHTVRTYTPVQFARHKKIQQVDIAGHFYWGSRFEAMVHKYAGMLLA
jgi:hypothetical protein